MTDVGCLNNHVCVSDMFVNSRTHGILMSSIGEGKRYTSEATGEVSGGSMKRCGNMNGDLSRV